MAEVPEVLFSVFNYCVIPFWVLMCVFPCWKQHLLFVQSRLIPLLLAIAYTIFLLMGTFITWDPEREKGGGMGSLDGLIKLFHNKWTLLAAWIHYLCFDLFTGTWEVLDARDNGIPHIFVVPCLVLTLLYGPVGFLLYNIIRYALVRKIIFVKTESMNTNCFDCCLPGCKDSNNFLGINWWFFLEIWFGSKQFWKNVFLINHKQQEKTIIDDISYQQE